jgi:hypothetical protein
LNGSKRQVKHEALQAHVIVILKRLFKAEYDEVKRSIQLQLAEDKQMRY